MNAMSCQRSGEVEFDLPFSCPGSEAVDHLLSARIVFEGINNVVTGFIVVFDIFVRFKLLLHEVAALPLLECASILQIKVR
jgi:hypothetical protein